MDAGALSTIEGELSNMINKSIYVVPSWKCNLHCPHCFVHQYSDVFLHDKFIKSLKELKIKYPYAHFVLHGGEPTLYKDRYFEIMNTNIINSICSNLIIDDIIMQDLNNRNIDIATSWNPNRFTSILEKKWLDNISNLKIKPLILITLDKDLMNYELSKFITLLHKLEEVGVTDVLFEPLYDNTLDDTFQNKADEWLCNVYHMWRKYKIKLINKIENQIQQWNFRCNSLTLLPDGTIRSGCILGNECHKILDKCLKCEFAKICQPCVLHNRCSFYPKFYRLVTNA